MKLRLFISILLLVSAWVITEAQDVVKTFKIDNIKYDLYSDNTAILIDGKKAKGDVTIPANIEYKKQNFIVIKIGEQAFFENGEIRGVNIESGIAEIGSSAFSNCASLKKVIVPNTVKYIGEKAFSHNPMLESVVLPDDKPKFDRGAYLIFSGCKKIASIKGNTIEYPQYVFSQLPDYCTFMQETYPKIKSKKLIAERSYKQESDNNIQQNNHNDIAIRQPLDRSFDVNSNIPTTAVSNSKTFAVIIGNENYKRVTKVDFAKSDAAVFALYCEKTLGLPKSNIRSYTDATYGDMITALSDIKQISEVYKGQINIIFYYAGHGVPNEADHSAFLLPVDVDGSRTDLCLGVNDLYNELSSMNVLSTIIFMDACFSGSQRGEGMLTSARGVALKAKPATPKGNMVVFSAATGEETAYPYKQAGHGMFTYFLLKKLQDTKGEATLGELFEYINTEVSQKSIVENRKSQTPTISSSYEIGDSWKTWKLK